MGLTLSQSEKISQDVQFLCLYSPLCLKSPPHASHTLVADSSVFTNFPCSSSPKISAVVLLNTF